MTGPTPREAYAPRGASPAADFDRRFYAFAIDRLVAWGSFGAAGYLAWRFLLDDDRLIAGLALIAGTVVLVSFVYAVLLGVVGVSPGKALMGLRVVRDADGQPIGILQALVRTTVLGIATLPTVGLGLATLAWTAVMDPGGRRRGAHDRLSGAVVVDVRPVPEQVVEIDDRPRQMVNLTAMRLLPPPKPSTPDDASAPPETRVLAPLSSLPSEPPPSSPPPVPPAPPLPAHLRPVAAPTSDRPVAPLPFAGQFDPPTVRRPMTPSAGHGWRVTFDTGESFLVEGLALLGRRPEARDGEPVRHLVPLRSRDSSLSKTHAQFQVVPEGALVIMDRGSTNGSIVVRQGVSKALTEGRPTTLLDGDTVRFGDRSMSVTKEQR